MTLEEAERILNESGSSEWRDAKVNELEYMVARIKWRTREKKYQNQAEQIVKILNAFETVIEHRKLKE